MARNTVERQQREQWMRAPALVAAVLAVLAIGIGVLAVVGETSALSIVATGFAVMLVPIVVWQQRNLAETEHRLSVAEREIDHLALGAPAAVAAESPEPSPTGPLEPPSENFFIKTFHARLASASRHLRPMTLVLLDAVHDGSGAATPVDETRVADVLRDTLRASDNLGRLRSGSFAMLLEDTPTEGAEWSVERIRAGMAKLDDDVSVWVGMAVYPVDGLDVPELLTHANSSLDTARRFDLDG